MMRSRGTRGGSSQNVLVVTFVIAVLVLLWNHDRSPSSGSSSGHRRSDGVTPPKNNSLNFHVSDYNGRFVSLTDHVGSMTGVLASDPSVSWDHFHVAEPRLYMVYNTLTPADCEELIGLAKKRLQRSLVNSDTIKQSGDGIVDDIRTSFGMFLQEAGEVDALANLKLRSRIAEFVGLPVAFSEATQILRYLPGQTYRVHPDYFSDEINLSRAGQRVVTALTWLNQVPEGGGGATAFPNSKDQVKAYPRLGSTVVFYDVHEDLTVDPTSWHAGEPPNDGSTKYVAVMWFHLQEFH